MENNGLQDMADNVMQFVEPRQQAIRGVAAPCLIAAVSTLFVSIFDSVREERMSPIFGLTFLFAGLGIFTFARCDKFAKYQHVLIVGRRSMACIVLGWMLVTFFVIGYHTPLHDMGCIRAGGAFLILLVASNIYEAMLYMFIHLLLSLGAQVPCFHEEILFLVVTDMYMAYASWNMQMLVEATEWLIALSQHVSKFSMNAVSDTLKYLCDAVVAVNQDLVLLESASELGAMLGQARTKGRSFQEFIHNDDKADFAPKLCLSLNLFQAEPVERQEAMQVRLVDVYGSPFSVHVFIAAASSHLSDIKSTFYLLGICEQWNRRKKDEQPKAQDTVQEVKWKAQSDDPFVGKWISGVSKASIYVTRSGNQYEIDHRGVNHREVVPVADFPSFMRFTGELDGDTIRWSNGSKWTRVKSESLTSSSRASIDESVGFGLKQRANKNGVGSKSAELVTELDPMRPSSD